jgi:hypothetical protein
LEGAYLGNANLAGANLLGAYFSTATSLKEALLSDSQFGCVAVAGVRWGGIDLSIVKWAENDGRPLAYTRSIILGDELWAREKTWMGRPKSSEQELEQYKSAVHANRQLATALRAQGLNEDADRFAYKAQKLQQRVLWRQHRYGTAFGSWFLDIIAGYGYRPLRAFGAYAFVIALFTVLYLINTQFAAPRLSWDEALVLSISAFHGRGFFTSGISLGDTLARLAAGEAIIGLLIEITFIATFTQRFFAR